MLWHSVYDEYGIPESLEPYPDRAVDVFVRDSADEYGGRGALVQDGNRLTYDELRARVKAVAAFLGEHGVGEGDAVGTMLPTSTEFVALDYAASYVGATHVPLDPLEHDERVRHRVEEGDVSLVVHADEYAGHVEDIGVPTFGIEPDGTVGFAESSGDVDRTGASGDETHAILFTGGTTGLPKGCIVTHRNIVANVLQVEASLGRAADLMRGNATVLNALPVYHSYGYTMTHTMARLGVEQLLVSDPRDTDLVARLVEEHDPLAVMGVPTQFLELADEDVDALGVSGSAPLADETRDEYGGASGGIAQGYGLSEMSPVTHFDIEGVVEGVSGVSTRELSYDVPTVGVPVPDTRVVLRGTDTGDEGGDTDDGADGFVSVEEAARNDEGYEMLVDGPQRVTGYVDGEDRFVSVEENGETRRYVPTGDVVKVDSEGRFYVVDRVKDMINVSGLKVYTESLEDTLQRHDAVRRCAAVGVPDPDRPGSELVKVYVETEGGATTDGDDVRDFLRGKVEKHAVPDEVEFVDELPLTSVGKVDKKALG